MDKIDALKRKVFVGLSGGVDSSVAAVRLLKAGYHVVGVFIKVWHPSFLPCDWEKERLDAMRVCATLGIPFLTCDATERYKHEVADYLIAEYKAGRTPNPDVMCNKHIKFGAFLDFADEHGTDYIATGHYVRREGKALAPQLLRGADPLKDQSYFLWTLSPAQLARTLFPIGDSLKSDIRKEATRYGLPTAEKPDSQGVCFLGELDMKSFLSHFIPPVTGKVNDMTGRAVGEHNGAHFYTIGQRHGFRLHQATPNAPAYYVIAKNLDKNTLTVSHEKPTIGAGAQSAPASPYGFSLSFLPSFSFSDTNWISAVPARPVEIQTRYRQLPVDATVEITGATTATVTLLETLDTPADGQSCVIYDGDIVLGGGIINSLT